jgi:ABC-type dipeptide/oligopeptide/nickel transport system ATPase component
VLISHDLGVVDAMVDDVVVMFAGRVVERISATQLRTAPDETLHPYTRALRASQRTRAAGQRISTELYKTPLRRAATGCAFQLRCTLRPLLPVSTQQQCAAEAPPEHGASQGRSQACWGQGA